LVEVCRIAHIGEIGREPLGEELGVVAYDERVRRKLRFERLQQRQVGVFPAVEEEEVDRRIEGLERLEGIAAADLDPPIQAEGDEVGACGLRFGWESSAEMRRPAPLSFKAAAKWIADRPCEVPISTMSEGCLARVST
jgi:hypothetical protein